MWADYGLTDDLAQRDILMLTLFKIVLQGDEQEILRYIDGHHRSSIERLGRLIATKS